MGKKTPTTKDALENVVRARLGDQNAMGWLEELGKAARRGESWAKKPYEAVLAYGESNPAEPVDIGAEAGASLAALGGPVPLDPDALLGILCFLPHSGDSGALESAVVLLSHGPEVTPAMVGDVQARVPQANLPAFRRGAEFSGEDGLAEELAGVDPVSVGFCCAGNVLGLARKIQQVRAGAEFGVLSAEVGWELDGPTGVPAAGGER